MTNTLPKIDVRPDHWAIVRGILQKHVPQYEVWAFGSRAKWTAKEYSDLDLAVISDKPLPLDMSASLSDDFSESDLPWKVDVVDWATTSESFRKIIERDRVVVRKASWIKSRIGDVAEVYDGPHATPAKTAAGPIFLGISSLNSGRINLSGTEHLSEEDFAKWTKRVIPSAGDVVFSYETRIGEAAIIPAGLRCCLGRRMGLVRPDPNKLAPHFFLYQYLSPSFQDFLRSRTIHGSTVDRIALKEFPDFEINLPPLRLQQQIAKVMVDIDSKIDLNRRINQTLEAMAQAIFKSWFVDFDPVKAKIAAKQEGRDPLRAAMSAISGKPDAELDTLPREQFDPLAATAALFPDEMEESELGEIPRGWTPAGLSEIAEVVMGQSPDGESYNDSGNGVALINGPVEFDSYHPKRIKWTTLPSKTSDAGDLIVCVRGSTTGKFVKSDGIYCLGRGVCAIRAQEQCWQPFVDQTYKFSLTVLLSLATGSTFPSWSGPTLKNHRVLHPTSDLMGSLGSQ